MVLECVVDQNAASVIGFDGQAYFIEQRCHIWRSGIKRQQRDAAAIFIGCAGFDVIRCY